MSSKSPPVRVRGETTQPNQNKQSMSTTPSNPVVQPYLFFNGRCEEAVEFYRQTLGAEVEMIMKYNQSPEPPKPGMVPPGFENKIMHASFRVGQTTIMASDGCSLDKPAF